MPGYSVTLTRSEDGHFVATFPDVPQAVATGQTGEEALAEAAKALEAEFRRRILGGEDLPVPEAPGTLQILQEVLAAAFA
ncbi:MAG: HicB like antitoxin of bacterial toxin-antitoxin system [Alphaproteobacteria bacterium]|nr:HicB like antitoxin of bacterial toxin-antitoxin system [Alphaproteobacteria bacterium]